MYVTLFCCRLDLLLLGLQNPLVAVVLLPPAKALLPKSAAPVKLTTSEIGAEETVCKLNSPEQLDWFH